MNKDKTILFVMPRLPFPASSGRKTSLYHYCRILSKELGYRLVVAAFLESGDDPTQKPDFIDKLVVLPKPEVKTKVKNIIKDSIILRNKPLQVSLYWNPEAKKVIDEICNQYNPDYVIGDMVRSTEYIKDINATRIADLDDRISLRYQRQLDTDVDNVNPYGAFLHTVPKWLQRVMLLKPLKMQVMKSEISLLKRYEIEIGKCCDRTVFVAEKEAQDFNRELRQTKAFSIPIGVDTDYFSYRKTGNSGNIIGFLGAMSVAHNENAVFNFIENILPLIVKKIPDVKFLIIGGGASEVLQGLESEHVHFTGYVEDVREFLQQCKVFVCPMTFGSGIKTKNLEVMALGIPVITTSIGAENISASNNDIWIVRDSNKEFAEAVIKLMKDSEYRTQVGSNGCKYIRENWTWDIATTKFREVLEKRE